LFILYGVEKFPKITTLAATYFTATTSGTYFTTTATYFLPLTNEAH
jgi:hypothetical protein